MIGFGMKLMRKVKRNSSKDKYKPRKESAIMDKRKPLVWAHRGASGYCPENTIPAFEKAVEMNAHGVELDVQLTKDGEIVVCHDEEIDRTSNGKGWIKDFTLEELREFDFSNDMDGFLNLKIPTMREVFELLKPTDLTINIELKTGIVFYPGIEEKLIELAEEMEFMDRVIFSSFNHYTILKIKELKPRAKCGFLYMDGTIDMPGYAKKYGVEALHPALYNLQFPGYMEECIKNNLEVNVWTVNKEEYAALCCKAGANSIITNYPDMVFGVIEKIMG